MIIKSIQLSNFRNYEKLDISFDSETNIIYGDNAQGKTNILEAAYLSGTTKSHKGSKDKEMIRFGEDEAHIRTIVEKNDKEYRIDMHLRKNGAKGVAINKMPIKKASELFGILNIVFFSPEDLNIIKNGPAERRRFIDLELCQLDKIYLSNLSKYNKTLVQRNRLLKDIAYRPDLIDTLQVWDMQLLEYGRHVIKKRREFVNELNEIIQDIHSNISGGREKLILKYEPSIDDIFFEDELLKARNRDLKPKFIHNIANLFYGIYHSRVGSVVSFESLDKEKVKKSLEKMLSDNEEILDDKIKIHLGLDEVTDELIKLMEKFEENDALSFGVGILWIKSYEEVPSVLKNIRIGV